MFELRARGGAGGGGVPGATGDLGLLHAVDDRLAVYGFETNTGTKFIAVVDMRGRGGAVGAGTIDRDRSRGAAAVGLREGELKPVGFFLPCLVA